MVKLIKPIYFTTEVYFRDREQHQEFVKKLVNEDIDFKFSCWNDHVSCGSKSEERWYVQIEDMPWANNHNTISKLLKEVSHEDI